MEEDAKNKAKVCSVSSNFEFRRWLVLIVIFSKHKIGIVNQEILKRK
jgi:hypothetical protein